MNWLLLLWYCSSLHWHPVRVRSKFESACLCHHCRSSTTPSWATEMMQNKPPYTPNTCFSSYNLHTVMHHLVIARLILLLFLYGTPLQMMSGVSHHCHYWSLSEDILASLRLQRLNFLLDHCTYVHDLFLSLICCRPCI